ncbi:MAG: tetratricopeptide repeat protein, partial [Flavobacteriia bacterium]|nr:tetratricopeptide repeat protein [Flavobacteriia bacterium]
MANKLPPNLLHIYDSEGSKYLVNCDKEKGFKITFEQEQNTAEHRDEFMEKNDEYIDVYSEINFRTQNSTWPLNFGGFDKKNGFYKKIILKYPFSWQGVMIDLLLRVISFWLYYTGLIGPIFFLLAQTLFAIIVLAGLQEIAAKRQKLNLLNQLGFHPENWRSLDVESSSRIGGWLLFFAFLGQLVIQWQCMPVEWYFWLRILLIVLAGCVHSLTYSGLALNGLPYFFLQNRLSDELEMHHEHIDKNDVQIAQIQAKVDDLKQKIDTYTIESALMGALAISSYLAIFQTGVIKTKDLTLLQNKLWSTFHDFLFFRFSRSFTAFIDLFNQHTFLWALILFFAATCAILYLMLLISRKRVYSQIAEINVHLELSKTFNNKEEEIYNLSLQNSQNKELTHRQRRVTEQCDMHLKEAEKTLGLVLESTQILESLRKTATFLFILLICSSACFLTPYLGLAFLMVFIFMQLAFQRDLKNFNLKKRKSKDEETKKSDSFKKLGSFNYEKGKYTLALEFYQKAAKIEETLISESESLATTYNWVGNSYHKLQSYALALEFFQKAAKIRETLNPESESMATTYGNVGASYYKLQSYGLALEFFQKAAKIRETL